MSDDVERWYRWVFANEVTGMPSDVIDSARIALASAKWRDRYRKKLSQAKTEKYRMAIQATLRVLDDILSGEGPTDE